MKKVLVSVLVIVILATMSLTAFAAASPVSVGEYTVTVGSYATGELQPADYTVNPDGTITVRRAASSELEFEGWKISGKYEIVSGSLMGDTLTIRPLGDIRVIEMYDCAAAGAEDTNPTSPPTGSNLLALGAIAMLSLSVAVVAKKRLAA